MKKYVSIDPGLSGAIAVIDEDGKHLDHLFMPAMKVGNDNQVNIPAVREFLIQHDGIEHCFIEKVGGINKNNVKQSASGAFKFGDAYGCVKGVVAGMGIPCTYLTPQVWKKHAGILGKDKDASRGRCVQLYPQIKELALKAKGQALGDALLIGRCGLKLG